MDQPSTPTPPPAPMPDFEPGRLYRVSVSRVVDVGALRIRPRGGATLLGEVAETIKDAIVAAEPVE